MRIKLLLSSLLIATAMQAQTNGNEAEPDFEGKTATYFYYDDEMYVNTIGYTKRNLLEERVYIMENNEVYLQEFIDFIGFIKGTINKDAGTITIKNGQEMGTKQFKKGGATHKVYFATMNTTIQQPEDGEFTLKYIDKGNGNMYIDGGSLCFSLYYLNEEKPTIFLHTTGLKMVSKTLLDAAVQKATYEYTDIEEGGSKESSKIDCIKYGENIYFNSLEASVPNKWQVAKILQEGENMLLFIPNNQFITYVSDAYFVFKTATTEGNNGSEPKEVEGLKIPMVLDETTHTYKCTTANNELLGALAFQVSSKGTSNEWVTKYTNISITIPESQITDGISSVTQPKKQENTLYYDLQGRAYKYPSKGIYIHNGKKIVVK